MISSKKIKLELKRCFREIETEKWFFKINDDEFDNFFLLFRLDINYLDLVINNRYKKQESNIISEYLNGCD